MKFHRMTGRQSGSPASARNFASDTACEKGYSEAGVAVADGSLGLTAHIA